MDFRQFQYITTIARLRNVTKAADALYISQSALSHFIKATEDELGVRLFDRSTNPISLTDAGRCYIESAQRILLENEKLMKEIRDITNHMAGTLKIGTSGDRCSYMIPKLLPRFYSHFPEINVSVVTGGGNSLYKMLREGEIDMVLLPCMKEYMEQGFVYEKLYSEELLLAAAAGTVPREDRIDGHHMIKPEYLDGKPFFIQEPGHIHRACCDALFRKYKIKPDIRQVFASNIACYRMAATGEGLTIVPFMTTQLSYPGNEVELFSIGKEPSTWDIYIIYRKDGYLGQPERKLIEVGKEIFKEEQRSPKR